MHSLTDKFYDLTTDLVRRNLHICKEKCFIFINATGYIISCKEIVQKIVRFHTNIIYFILDKILGLSSKDR